MISLDGHTFGDGIHLISGRVGSGKSTFARRLVSNEAEFTGHRRLLLLQEIEYHITGSTFQKELESWGVTGSEPTFALCKTLSFSRDPYTVSRGELKRFLLACILSSDVDCLILDEPYASLDQDAKEMLTAFLKEREGVVILFSHECPAIDLCRWQMSGGKLCRI